MPQARFSERTAEILRGWPNGAALDRAEVIKASALKANGGTGIGNGTWVVKQPDNTVDVAGSTKTNVAGLVVSGDLDSASSAGNLGINSGNGAFGSGKAVVLWGNFIASINAAGYAAGSYAPGDSVTVQSGKLVKAVVGTDPVIGKVLDVIAASSNNDAALVIQVA